MSAVGLICGSGSLPIDAADLIQRAGRPVFLAALKGSAAAEVERFPHVWIRMGEIGKLFRSLEGAGVREVALVGAVQRPALKDLRIDMGGLGSLPEITRLLAGGDDHLLRGVIKFVEDRGFVVRGVHEVAPELAAPLGLVGRRQPNAADVADIALAVGALRALGPFDVGQGVVAIGRRVVAVEAAEGTDSMLGRVTRLSKGGKLRRDGRGGVLVKTPKRSQDLRVDLPAIGVRTLELAAEAQLAGVAVAAGQVLLADRDELAAKADEFGLFLAGVPVAEAA
ncbi:LpxI family protein [Methylopila sp. Yamaguchi]|uniref:LpxI family protein n=1 Tax=Methylopila sp. Yamaguchi TaxID=1437817 RepID=UPI000CB0D42D|nr:UDP-2,3-diacylglucosamine diphosphatase LpxI [Methylopila sp. Yamaguchi]GBD49371.1 hypothetical protein METY_2584 [Methylopila sp. Yamaguchi]